MVHNLYDRLDFGAGLLLFCNLATSFDTPDPQPSSFASSVEVCATLNESDTLDNLKHGNGSLCFPGRRIPGNHSLVSAAGNQELLFRRVVQTSNHRDVRVECCDSLALVQIPHPDLSILTTRCEPVANSSLVRIILWFILLSALSLLALARLFLGGFHLEEMERRDHTAVTVESVCYEAASDIPDLHNSIRASSGQQ